MTYSQTLEVRGLLGEPTRLDYASLALNQVTVMLRFGDLPAAVHWIDLPGIARYGMEFALYAPDAPWSPGFRDGAAVQAVCGAMETSAASGRWVSVSEVLASAL